MEIPYWSLPLQKRTIFPSPFPIIKGVKYEVLVTCYSEWSVFQLYTITYLIFIVCVGGGGKDWLDIVWEDFLGSGLI